MTAEEIREILEQFFQRGTQTYVGMRYVPVFADPIQWDDSVEYEPLTMVTYDDDIYVSKFYVPVGVSPTDTDFWVVFGSTPSYIPTTPMSDAEIDAITGGA